MNPVTHSRIRTATTMMATSQAVGRVELLSEEEKLIKCIGLVYLYPDN